MLSSHSLEISPFDTESLNALETDNWLHHI